MNQFKKLTVVALSSILAVSLLAACGKGDDPEPTPGPPAVKTEEGVFARICYDNLVTGSATSYVNEADTKFTVSGDVENVTAKDAAGESADADEIAVYDSATKTFTAVSSGTVDFELDGKLSRIEVVPAYVTNPNNAYYKGNGILDEERSTLLGNTHDPSFIAREEGGKTVCGIALELSRLKSRYAESDG